MDQAQQQDLLAAGTREVFAVNALWVVVPPQATAAPRSLKNLAGASVQRIALGNPDSVPVGRYAKGALEKAGLWPSVQGKTITTQNVRQSLDYVARGDARPGAPGLRSAGVGAHRLSAGGDQGQCAAGRGQALHGVRAFGAGPGDPGQARVRQALRHGSRLERTGVVAEGGRLGHRDQSGAGPAGFTADPADGAATDGTGLLPAGADRTQWPDRRVAAVLVRYQPGVHLAGRGDRGSGGLAAAGVQAGTRGVRGC
ncbi:hypothetical protein G6F50_013629 [Rhizopus delemar]|uniref:Uncharacterized protein n=1 Tax=Rhizopus delemar TaxID=936053 RepID=A0A9P6YFG7_9FUNG|nr:hypothetical protein G6F50_013629 [Rhizopus delemar]